MARPSAEEKKAARRTQILEAAKKVFARKGYYGATMGDVAREAGVSYGVPYWYFPNKMALFEALMEAEAEALKERIARAVTATPNPLERLRIGLEETLRFFDEDQSVARLLFRDAYALGPSFEKKLVEIYGRFVRLIRHDLEHAAKRGLLRPLDLDLAAYMIAALLGQLAFRRLTAVEQAVPVEEIAGAALDFILRGITQPLSAPKRQSGRRSTAGPKATV